MGEIFTVQDVIHVWYATVSRSGKIAANQAN